VVTATTPAASTTEDAPASSKTRSGDFDLVLFDSRRFIILPFYQFDTNSPNCYLKMHGVFLANMEHISGIFPQIRENGGGNLCTDLSENHSLLYGLRRPCWLASLLSAKRATASIATFSALRGQQEGVYFSFRRLSH
jgi:hypothetical protein